MGAGLAVSLRFAGGAVGSVVVGRVADGPAWLFELDPATPARSRVDFVRCSASRWAGSGLGRNPGRRRSRARRNASSTAAARLERPSAVCCRVDDGAERSRSRWRRRTPRSRRSPRWTSSSAAASGGAEERRKALLPEAGVIVAGSARRASTARRCPSAFLIEQARRPGPRVVDTRRRDPLGDRHGRGVGHGGARSGSRRMGSGVVADVRRDPLTGGEPTDALIAAARGGVTSLRRGGRVPRGRTARLLVAPRAVERCGALDVLVNNAVLPGAHSKPLLETETRDWDAMMAVNLAAVPASAPCSLMFALCKVCSIRSRCSAATRARADRRPSLPPPGWSGRLGPLSRTRSARAAWCSLTRQVAVELRGATACSCNAVAPGKIVSGAEGDLKPPDRDVARVRGAPGRRRLARATGRRRRAPWRPRLRCRRPT